MKITREAVDHVANLARLEITDAEADEFTIQLNSILEYADKLNRLDTKDITPTAHVMPMQNVFREDEVHNCLPREQALANAPEEEDGMFRVPPVIE
ncbi:Asp-tRNA(Asn)/Glu-tRNA(Gln) amidotransferase subunit GatC [Dethiobacter alkaliphilus]|uniref:Asp-tRNA(Asn)/Glu-tRNA(Gln) amidotransferase subunit GatC n=1 Tax=Dethiobacter alkaliphilus TaxID=427926 RepID=UPI002225DEEB|nr:Asp-tRNA(Asn)/Glu-tRNA(Gln) amidotransferase subunit GatC [Dethiobacter alkaliphilus]MCW3489807.1 Asp-tRNA(Asn)/Glu-tRNA(Gln) amidotransferase subunit GatC [Dethiobacter alkaliphilus]